MEIRKAAQLFGRVQQTLNKVGFDVAFDSIERGLLKQMNKKINEVNKAKDELQKKLAKHDLNFLAVEKPKLIERIINKGSMGVLDEIENLTK